MIAFVSNSGYVPGSPVVAAPVVGLYVISDPSITESYLSWQWYYTSNTTTLNVIKAIAFSSDGSLILLGFGSNFALAYVDVWSGQPNYSGASATSSKYIIGERGVAFTNDNLPLVTF